MTPSPIITVVITAYNAAWCIEAALASCLAQTHAGVEVIVVDDASSDQTRAVVEQWVERDSRVHLIVNEANLGPGASRNRALAHATGDWITVLDADDWYHPERLARLLGHALALGPGGVLFDLIETCIEDSSGGQVRGRVTNRASTSRGSAEIVEVPVGEFLRKDLGAQPFFSRELLLRTAARYPEQERFGEDLAFLVRLLTGQGARLFQLCQVFYFYRIRLSTLSSAPKRLEVLARVLDQLLADPAVSGELRASVLVRRARIPLEQEELDARTLLRQRRWGDASRAFARSPSLTWRVARSVPAYLRYRIPLLMARRLRRT